MNHVCRNCGGASASHFDCERCLTDERMDAGAAVVARTLKAWTEPPLARMARESIDDYVQYVERVTAEANERNAEFYAMKKPDGSALN